MNKTKQKHVVLGNGAIGIAVLESLRARNIEYVGVSKNIDADTGFTVSADLLDKNQAKEAIDGASHVYVCIGLPYDKTVWQRDWPLLIKNIIDACANTKAKLILFDNIYMYGPTPLPVNFDEQTPQKPPSVKGAARKIGADLVLKAHNANKIEALIGRSADFYGPGAVNSSLYVQVLENMLKAKNPGWIGNKKDVKRTYAFTQDNAEALVMLALDGTSYGKTWHLPVSEPLTIDDVVAHFNTSFDSSFKVSYMPRPVLIGLSFFIKPLKELREMLYQFDQTYIMDDSKFMTKYPDFKKTDITTGIKLMVEDFKEQS